MKQYKNGTILHGQDLDDLLFAGIEYNKSCLIEHLSQFNGNDLFHNWLKLLRCIDEFINLRFAIQPAEWSEIGNYSANILCNKRHFIQLLAIIRYKYGDAVSERIKLLIVMIASMKMTYQKMGHQGMEFKTIADTIDFFQSRRLYYVSYLSLIRIYCKGEKKVPFMELLCNFQYQIDFNMRSITSAFHAILGNNSIDGYGAIVHDNGLEYTFPYNQLDDFFLEPLAMSELDILEYEESPVVRNASTCVPRRLYSYAELEHTVDQVANIFGGYGINECPALEDAKKMVVNLKGRFDEDYFITFSEKEFVSFSSEYSHLKLQSVASNYFEALNERPAFFHYKGLYYSNVLLMIRYIENAVYGLLRRNRRYRIKAGFVFEKKIKALLEQYGFESTETKRIHKQEFDVICMKDGCAYNFQCKNNFLDINTVCPDNIKQVCRQNKRLAKYYLKALDKENFRTKLVQEHFDVNRVENYVVARFPVVSNHERIIPYNKLEGWLVKFTSK